MIEFKDRLEKLMSDNQINAENLSKNLNNQLSANTIRNYLRGKTQPKSIEPIRILANYFKVSRDYLQGLTEAETTNIEIKNISNEYGLSDKALEFLYEKNRLEKKEMGNTMKRYGFSIIDTINCLLENKELINSIDAYFNAEVNKNYVLGFIRNGDIALYDRRKTKKMWGRNFIESDTIEQTMLFVIQNELKKMKEEMKKEGEGNECKRTRKK